MSRVQTRTRSSKARAAETFASDVMDKLDHWGDELVRLGATMSASTLPSQTGTQPSYIAKHGKKLLRNGFDIIPVKPRSKVPSLRAWTQLANDKKVQDRAIRRSPTHSVGIDARRTPVIDLDCSHASVVNKLRQELGTRYGPLLERLGRAPRICIPFRANAPFSKILSSLWIDDEGKEQRLEVLGAGQQFVAYGYHPDTGLPYTWYLDGEPSALTRFSRDALPELTCDAAIGWANRFDEMAGSLGWKLIADPSRATKNAKPAARLAGKRLDVRDEELEEVVSAIPDPQDYNQWIRVGMCLRHQAEDPQAGLVIWKKWSSQAANFDSDACDRKWTTFCHEGKETYLTGKTLYRLAGRPAPDRDTAADLPLSEDAVARAFAERHVENLRYDHDLGKWMYFDGVRWQKEKTELALDYARDICRELRTECADTRAANALSRASSAAAVERLARSDRTFAVVSDIWDKDRFLLGTPGGTVDLCSGVLRPTCREHCITMITAVAPLASCSPEVDMPVFWKFLKEVTSGDMEVINYLQRFGGYCLTGDTREQMLLFVHGPGGNGKSLFQSIIAEIIGEYAWTAPPEMFTSSRSERHPTELASLRGKRLVIASENETGKAWAEVRIKQVTGGDRITARLMRQDFFEFDLRAKFFFVGNNQPTLKQVDEAMKRRFHVLEFAYSPDKPDKGLAAKLKPEWPAILRWLIDGCLAWQREGLAPPEAIVAATEEYFDEQDVVKEWLELSCEIGPDYAVANMDIKESFQQFSQSRGGIVCSDPLPALRQRFTRIKNKCGVRGRGLLGLRLKIPEEET